MGTKKNGLLALLGLGAIAWGKYKNASPEEKQKVAKIEEEKINNKLLSKKMNKKECLIM